MCWVVMWIFCDVKNEEGKFWNWKFLVENICISVDYEIFFFMIMKTFLLKSLCYNSIRRKV